MLCTWTMMKFLSTLSVFMAVVASVKANCLDSFTELAERESRVNDFSILRTYVFCPGSIMDIGTLDHNYEVRGTRGGKDIPLQLRPNMRVICGDDGSRANNCAVTGGSVHVDATGFMHVQDQSTVFNVEIVGFTFKNVFQYSVWATKQGSITFRDCEFSDILHSVVPVLMDYYDQNNPSTSLDMTFKDCDFFDNRYLGLGSNTALIYANGEQNHLEIAGANFVGNDMLHNNTLSDRRSFLVESLGPVDIRRSCFENNQVGVSNVIVYGSTLTTDNIYLANSNGGLCPFASVFLTIQQFDDFTPLCVGNRANTCLSAETPAPTSIPTSAPTSGPTGSPVTDVPTSVPTGAPTAGPTSGPTGGPTAGPTGSPTGLPTLVPTAQPVTPPPFSRPPFDFPTTNENSPSGATSQMVLSTGLAAIAVLVACMLF